MEKWDVERFLLVLAPIGFLWNNLWSVSRYIIGWRQGGIDQQRLAAPIWKYRSGFGDHRFTFFIDLLPNYTFYTSLTNIALWVIAYRDVAHPITLNLGKSWEKYAKSFDAGLNCWRLWLTLDPAVHQYTFIYLRVVSRTWTLSQQWHLAMSHMASQGGAKYDRDGWDLEHHKTTAW